MKIFTIIGIIFLVLQISCLIVQFYFMSKKDKYGFLSKEYNKYDNLWIRFFILGMCICMPLCIIFNALALVL